MIDYTVYKFIHFLGIIMIFVSLGGVMVHVFNGGAKATTPGANRQASRTASACSWFCSAVSA